MDCSEVRESLDRIGDVELAAPTAGSETTANASTPADRRVRSV